MRLIGLCLRQRSNSVALPLLLRGDCFCRSSQRDHYDIENASMIHRAFEAALRGFRSMKTVLFVTLTTDIPTDYRLTSTWSRRY
jgi:hypothetical protein